MNLLIKKNGNYIEVKDTDILFKELRSGNIALRDMSTVKGNELWLPLYRNLKQNPFDSYEFYIAREGVIIDKTHYIELKYKILNNIIYKTDYYWFKNSTDWKLISELYYEESKFFIIVRKEDIECGPFDLMEIQDLLNFNKINILDLVWVEGLDKPVRLVYLLKYLEINPICTIEIASGELVNHSLECIQYLTKEGYLPENINLSGCGFQSINVSQIVSRLDRVNHIQKDSTYLENINKMIESGLLDE